MEAESNSGPEGQREDEQPVAEFWSGIFSFLAARLGFGLFIVFILLIGAWVAGAGLHDPDSCWLLALGRYIVHHLRLPATDPYSFTFAMYPELHFVMYQWLTEACFYAAYWAGGLIGLLTMAALVVCAAFVSIPMIALEQIKAPRALGIALAVLGAAAAFFHLLVRPEIFSYLCLSLWLWQLLRLRTEAPASENGFNRRIVVSMALIMLAWANMHTGFISGFIVLLSLTAILVLQVSLKQEPLYRLKTALAALAASLAVTLINPQGIGLWSYIPILFFPQFNKQIIELKPIGIDGLGDPFFFPFYILILIDLAMVVKALKRAHQIRHHAAPGSESRSEPINETLPNEPATDREKVRWPANPLVSVVVVIIAAAFSFHCRRLVPFASLILVMEAAYLWHCRSAPGGQDSHDSGSTTFWGSVDRHLRRIFDPDAREWLLIQALAVAGGVLIISTGPVKPTLPQGSIAFQAPFAAIEYLKSNKPNGHVLAAPQFADMMIWHLQPVPQVFIDTRFDMYGDKIVSDYMKLEDCQPGWSELMSKYEIDWVFMPPGAPLAKTLKAKPEWTTWFEDDNAVILERVPRRQ